jgi:hypothetical protein
MRISLFVIITCIFFSCEQDPTVPLGKGNFIDISTNDVSNIQDSRASTGISITNITPQYVIQERGVCWSTVSNPTISDSYLLASANISNVTLRDLMPGKKYFVRSFARINGTYTYGNQKEFETSLINSSLNSGLITLLPLNGDARDYSTSGNSLSGSATKAVGRTGVFNSAYTFNGSFNFLSVLSPRNIPTNNGPYSVSVWFRTGIWNQEMTIMGYGPSNTPLACNYVKTLINRGMVHYHWNFDFQFTNNSYSGIWTHLVITYDGGTERYYINGSLISSWPHATRPLIINPSILSLGARVINASNNDVREYFNGSIDEVRIYNRTLNSAEIVSLYNL